MILLIVNNNPYHYEIIESVINQYDKILSINKTQISKILLKIIPDESFIAYIKMKYPSIIINGNSYFNMKYLINVSIYHSNYDIIRKMKNSYYITHETHDDFKQHDNVLSTTPLCGTNKYMYFTDLPFSEKKQKHNIPIYIIQGELKRRNWNLLKKILERKYEYEYKIKIIGKGEIPTQLKELMDEYKDTIILKQHLSFQDYHAEFLDCYGIIPCISLQTNKVYYEKKITSSINYGIGYKLCFIIDNELQNIYRINNAYVYEKNIEEEFSNSLKNFYLL